MTPLGLSVPSPDFPVVGNFIPIAFVFMVHMMVAQYSLGAITLAASMELWGLRRGGDERALRYARALANSYYLVFSLGATLGVFAVTVLIGLWGRLFGDLVNAFLPLVGLAFGLFVIIAPLLVWYRNSFGRLDPARHVALGIAVAATQTLFMVLIVTIDAYMITPGRAGLLGGATNPAYWPLLLHRLVGNISWTALLLAGYAALRLVRSADQRERAFQAWAAGINLRIGVATAVLMPLLGFVLVEAIKHAVPGFFDNLFTGQAAWLFVVQSVMLGVILVGGNIALALEEQSWSGIGRTARTFVLVALAGSVVGVLPTQVLTGGVLWVRYAGIGVALAATLAHVLVRSVAYRPPRLAIAPGAFRALPFTASRMSRQALVAVGLTAFALSLYMGYIKDQARGQYAVYGELTQQQGHQNFAPSGIYP